MDNKKTAPFITLEGIDGSGKSSQIEIIQNYLLKRGYNVELTHEPGGTHVANKIRSIFKNENVDPTTELLLAFASRKEHLEKKIIPALNRGVAVICDRFTDSTYAYQGGGRNMADNEIKTLEDITQKGIKPDAVFYFEIDYKTSQQRTTGRGKKDRFDSEEDLFFNSVIEAYNKRGENPDNNYIKIDATKKINQVSKSVLEQLEIFINKWEKDLEKKNNSNKKIVP